MCRCGWLELLLLLLHQLHLQSAYTLLFYTHSQTFIDLPDWFSWQHEAKKPNIFFVHLYFLKETDIFQIQTPSVNARPAA